MHPRNQSLKTGLKGSKGLEFRDCGLITTRKKSAKRKASKQMWRPMSHPWLQMNQRPGLVYQTDDRRAPGNEQRCPSATGQVSDVRLLTGRLVRRLRYAGGLGEAASRCWVPEALLLVMHPARAGRV